LSPVGIDLSHVRKERKAMAEQGQPLVDSPPKMQVCVGSVVLREEKVLLVRQTYGETLKGKWTVPWGFVQGEDPSTYYDPPHVAALRETLEEAGVVAEIDGLLGIQNPSKSKEGDPRLYLLFLCHHISGEPTPDSRETDQAAYFSLDELRDIEGDVNEFCYWLATRVLQGQYTLVPPEPGNPYAPRLAFL
jgi:ADP-ribose pyrophosphatase YjhB (NUDIX family)